MSIKNEILLKRKEAIVQSGSTKEDNEKNNCIQAIEMLETFIIPKFREMAEEKPTLNHFFIHFYLKGSDWYYNTICNKKKKKSPYEFQVVKWAVFKAEDYDIGAEYKKDRIQGVTRLIFYINLTN